MSHYVYGLADPIKCNSIRYIGYSSVSPESRLAACIAEAIQSENPTAKHIWVQNILQLGLKPTVIILQYCANKRLGLIAEKFWICQAQLLGWEIFNISHVDAIEQEKRSRKAEQKINVHEDSSHETKTSFAKKFPIGEARELDSEERKEFRRMLNEGAFDVRGKFSQNAALFAIYGSKNEKTIALIRKELG